MKLKLKFVQFMPKEIKDDILYISPEFRAVIHRCACGCGEKVHTPLSPTNWKMIYDGKHLTLEPSIGNWSFDCRSHYWIKKNEIVWAENWSDEEVKNKRDFDKKDAEFYFESLDKIPQKLNDKKRNKNSMFNSVKSFWTKFLS